MTGRLALQRSCIVKFIDHDSVEQVICLSEKKAGRIKEDITYERIKADTVEPEFVEDTYKPSTVLTASDPDNEILQKLPSKLSSPKLRRNTPKASKESKKFLGKNGTSSPKASSHHKVPKTPSTSKRNKSCNEGMESGKRCSLRLRFKQIDLNDDTADSDLEASENDSADDEDDSISGEASDDNKKTPKKNKNMIAFAEDYFSAQKQKKSVTSNRTMSKVNLPEMSVKSLQAVFESLPEYHKQEKALLRKCHKAMFKKWTVLLEEGFCVLLYGIGSKINVLQDFCTSVLENETYLVINGFFPSLTIKQVLNSITEQVMDHTGTFPSIFEHAQFIKEHFDYGNEKLYLVVHNIDGPALRGMKIQSTLSSLASSPNIHFVASVDHINCSLIWDQVMLSHFKWVWYDITTYEPYTLETSYENSLLKDQSSHLILSSLIHVFQSLTPNGRGVFLVLAKHQHERKNSAGFSVCKWDFQKLKVQGISYLLIVFGILSSGFNFHRGKRARNILITHAVLKSDMYCSGIAFHDWYQECREAFLVNSELTMNAQLSEFKNHKLLASRKSPDGVECWYIPVEDVTLSVFLEKEADM